jgi:hypothetical protein
MKGAVVCVCILAWLAAGGETASAQSLTPAGRFEVGVGVDWIGQATLGTSDATETTPAGTPSRLFSTSSDLSGAAGFQVYVGVRVARSLELEAFASRSKPTITTTISNDVEASASTTATESTTQYVIGAGALWSLPFARGSSSRLVPFVTGSAAYLRQLHEGDTLVVTGQAYRVGGGLKYFFPERSSLFKGYGLRADVGVAVRVKGVNFDSGARYSPAAAGSFFVRF